MADRLRTEPMTEAESRSRAYAVWRAIDTETVTRTEPRETLARARRLADVARDLGRAHNGRASFRSLLSVIRYLAAYLTRLDGPEYAR